MQHTWRLARTDTRVIGPPAGDAHRRRRKVARRWLTVVGGAYLAALAVNRSLREVDGHSMQPTLWPGDRLLVVPARLRQPRRGDVVIVDDPRAPSRRTCKRVVGLPGEQVVLKAGRLSIDGDPLDEPYVAAPGRDRRSFRVPADRLLVLGDNRVGSTDSRTYGPVPRATVRAVAVASVRPWRASLRVTPMPRRRDRPPPPDAGPPPPPADDRGGGTPR